MYELLCRRRAQDPHSTRLKKVIYVVPEILRCSVEQAQIDDLVLHHFRLQLAEDNLRSAWSSGTATPAEEVQWQERFLDQML